MYALSGETADDVWRGAAALFEAHGPSHSQGSRGGNTSELLHVLLEIQDPRQRWVVSRTPPINPAFALVEVFWIAAGRQDASLPAFWNPRLPRFCGDSLRLEGAYGHRLRAHFGLDQLERVYRALLASPESRQAVFQIWDPKADLPREDGTPAREDIPCNVLAMPKLRRGRLEWLQVMRSNDVFRGLPYNIVQFTALQEMLAGWLGVRVGSYHHLSDSLHAYADDLEAVRSSTVPVTISPNTDSLALPRSEWDAVLRDVLHRLDEMTLSAATPASLHAAAFAGDLPAAYEQAVRLAAADAARRRNWVDLSEECANGCASSTLQMLWQRWATRVNGIVPESQPAPELPSPGPAEATACR